MAVGEPDEPCSQGRRANIKLSKSALNVGMPHAKHARLRVAFPAGVDAPLVTFIMTFLLAS
jgi:hypothetical protein